MEFLLGVFVGGVIITFVNVLLQRDGATETEFLLRLAHKYPRHDGEPFPDYAKRLSSILRVRNAR